VAYYESTLANSALRHTVTEWQPITSSMVVAGPFLALAAVMIWSFGRFPERTTLWDRLALLGLAAMTIGVIRNVAFFALGALMLVPVSLSGTRLAMGDTRSPVKRRLNSSVVGASLALTVLTAVVVIGRSEPGLAPAYPKPAMLTAVEHAAQAVPGLVIAADTRYGDWLLWKAPWLAGRIAADARFELYTAHEMHQFQDLIRVSGADWMTQAAPGDRLLVLSRSADGDAVSAFLHEPGARTLYRDRQTIVILRPLPGRPDAGA
jgi:hypothetical protein